MKKIYAPWRDNYVSGTVRKVKKPTCIFCKIFKEKNDEKNFIIRRSKNCATILNCYPYNAGHLMILPYQHKNNLYDLSKEIRAEIMEETNLGINILKKTLKPEAFNFGANFGKASGGGLPSHLHIHVVPRWSGDTNFMAVIAEAKPISFDLNKIYKKLKTSYSTKS